MLSHQWKNYFYLMKRNVVVGVADIIPIPSYTNNVPGKSMGHYMGTIKRIVIVIPTNAIRIFNGAFTKSHPSGSSHAITAPTPVNILSKFITNAEAVACASMRSCCIITNV
jgi:hypothetical protein